MDARFLKLITDLQLHLQAQKNLLSSYTVQVKPDKEDNLVWIKDHLGEIGQTSAHYEVRLEDDIVYVEIHFEDKKISNRQFFKHSGDLPQNIEPFIWWDTISYRYKRTKVYKMTDVDILDYITQGLLTLDRFLGNHVRKVLGRLKKAKI